VSVVGSLAPGFTPHASGELGGAFTPDASASGGLEKRIVGIPGDTVVGRGGWAFVNGNRADAIRTREFTAVHLEDDEYFVLGDKQSGAPGGVRIAFVSYVGTPNLPSGQ
jgi:hypothetical protein